MLGNIITSKIKCLEVGLQCPPAPPFPSQTPVSTGLRERAGQQASLFRSDLLYKEQHRQRACPYMSWGNSPHVPAPLGPAHGRHSLDGCPRWSGGSEELAAHQSARRYLIQLQADGVDEADLHAGDLVLLLPVHQVLEHKHRMDTQTCSHRKRTLPVPGQGRAAWRLLTTS